jgi:putative colanic acid biosynthesis UDP-glucose lipid carrier transferase
MNQSPRHVRHSNTFESSLMKLFDVTAISLGLLFIIRQIPEFNSKSTIIVTLLAIGGFLLLSEIFGVYRRWNGIAFMREVTTLILTWGSTLVLLKVLGIFSAYSTELSTPALSLWFVITPVLALSVRVFHNWYRRYLVDQGINARRFAIVGANELGIQLARNIRNTPNLGLKLLGYYDDRPDDRTGELPQDVEKKLGKIQNVIDAAKNGDVQVVFITLPMRAEERIRSLITKLADTTASVYIVPDLFVFQMLNSRWSDIEGVPVVSVFENPLFGVDGVMKRILDLVVSTAALTVAGIPMLLIATAVKLTSKGPVLFKQKRYGLDGEEINVWKFRSMSVCENGNKVTQAKKNDSRLTPIGGFLRKSSLDELPQIINVLTGHMSLVGPRPHANAHNEFYRKQIDGYMLRHKVKPGMTGLAQVNGCRGETETLDKMEKRVFFDHQYIREWSIWLDIKIILKTFLVVFSRQNAY